jgi:DNA modification methylase
MCETSLDKSSYLRLLEGELAEMVFADGPYNVIIDGGATGKGKTRHPEFQMASGEMSSDEFIAFLRRIMERLAEFSKQGSIHFQMIDWRHVLELLLAARNLLDLKNLCVWAKTNGGMGSFYRSQHEFVAVLKNGKGPHINNIALGKWGRNRTNLWTYSGVNAFRKGRTEDLTDHPTVKPVDLVADAILDCSNISGLVLDPFAGSGTTILACERTGRRAAAIEIDPYYVDVAIRRFEKATGIEAIHAETGRTFNAHHIERSRSSGGAHD